MYSLQQVSSVVQKKGYAIPKEMARAEAFAELPPAEMEEARAEAEDSEDSAPALAYEDARLLANGEDNDSGSSAAGNPQCSAAWCTGGQARASSLRSS